MISIIIPVYNKCNSMSKIFDALSKLESNRFEVIFVDDGSTDDSAAKIQEFIHKIQCANMFLYSQENKGVSEARNFGISHVSKFSEYVIFFDADDFFYPDKLNDIYDKVMKLSYDMYIFEYNVTKNGESHSTQELYSEQHDRRVILKDELYSIYSTGKIHPCWNKIYRLKTIKNGNIFFDASVSMGEDFRFNLSFLSVVDDIYYFNDVIYNYHIGNDDSLTSRYNENSFEYFKFGINSMMTLMNQLGCSSSNIYNRYIYALNDRGRNLNRSKLSSGKRMSLFELDFKYTRSILAMIDTATLSNKELLLFFLLKFNFFKIYYFLLKLS